MKIASAALAAVLLAAAGGSQTAAAQGLPQGSYMSSCSNAEMRGDTLVATCRRAGGGLQRTMLPGVNRCVGDVGNNNGVLQCAVPGGQARGQAVQQPPSPQPRHMDRPPPGNWPGQGRRDDDRGNSRAQCRQLQQRAGELHARRENTGDPRERARLEQRLGEVSERLREAGCRP